MKVARMDALVAVGILAFLAVMFVALTGEEGGGSPSPEDGDQPANLETSSSDTLPPGVRDAYYACIGHAKERQESWPRDGSTVGADWTWLGTSDGQVRIRGELLDAVNPAGERGDVGFLCVTHSVGQGEWWIDSLQWQEPMDDTG